MCEPLRRFWHWPVCEPSCGSWGGVTWWIEHHIPHTHRCCPGCLTAHWCAPACVASAYPAQWRQRHTPRTCWGGPLRGSACGVSGGSAGWTWCHTGCTHVVSLLIKDRHTHTHMNTVNQISPDHTKCHHIKFLLIKHYRTHTQKIWNRELTAGVLEEDQNHTKS